jgi:ribonuclease HI
MMTNKIYAYTDGSACVKGDRLGGHGVYIIDGDREYMFSFGYKNTTTGRQELMGAIDCLRLIKDKNREVEIYCDSEYVVKCITERRLWKWKRNLWMGIKNIELVIRFYEEYIKFNKPPKFVHIHGHQKNLEDRHVFGNNMADALADYKNQKEYKQDIIE